MQLFPYQTKIIQDILDHENSSSSKVPLVAMATGTGKGRVAVEIMSLLAHKNSQEKFLVLPHGQTNLRSNFVKELMKWAKPNLSFLEISPDSKPTQEEISAANVIVCLPQTAKLLIGSLGKITRIIVDEAHERYAKEGDNKKEYQEIRKSFPKAKELLLTASHGEFPNDKYQKFTISMLEAYEYGTVSDIALIGVNTKWDFTVNDYNQSGELLTEVDITAKKVTQALHDLILEMDSWHGIGSDSKTARAVKGKFVSAMKRLSGDFPKTIIATRSIDMAEQVYKFFMEHKSLAGSVILSHSKHDEDRLLEFNNNGNLKIAIVVNRANLGFDADKVRCVVDMTGTTNENRMVQLIGRAARVTRVNGVVVPTEKAYFKVMPQNMEMYTRALLQLSALLTTKDFYASYEGREPLKKQIYAFRTKRENPKPRGPKKETDAYFVPVPNKLSELIAGAEGLFVEYARKFGECLEVFTKTSLSSIKSLYRGGGNPDLKKQGIKDFFYKNSRFPSQHAKDPAEKKLGQALASYCSKSGNHDPEFEEWARSNGYGLDTAPIKKEEIKDFFYKHGRLPSSLAKDPAEKKLGVALGNYCRKSKSTHDPVFNEWARSNGYGLDTKSIKKQGIKDFFYKNSRFPSQHAKDPAEKKLGVALQNYCNKSSNTHDPAFEEWARSNGYGLSSSIKKQEIKDFFYKKSRFPSQTAKDLAEKKLGKALEKYCSKSSGTHDPVFEEWARSNGYGSRLKKNHTKVFQQNTDNTIKEVRL